MNLFLKIFLWFLAAIALMVGVLLFLNWSVQTEPVVSRWRTSVRNQMTIYAETAAQVHRSQGEAGMREFLKRIRAADTISEVDVISSTGEVWMADNANAGSYGELVNKAVLSGQVEIQFLPPETSLAAKRFTLGDGETYVLVVGWDRPRPTPFFGESPLRYLRYTALLLTALLLCYGLAWYISSPVGKIREATRKLAGGDLKTRVADRVGNRHDELASLARDFDEMAERIESLIVSQQRLSRDISHELRSPLARLNVALEIAKQKANGDASPQLTRIETESNRLNEMISRLLTLFKLESGSQDVDAREVDLKELVEQVSSDADFEAQAKGKAVRVTRADKCRISGNEPLLRSAVENVLRNAVKYTRDNTTVEVMVGCEKDAVRITVLDHGGGVPEEELKNLFRAFYRVGEARERKTGGSGLGLAIAERAVVAHRGTISAKNEGDGLLVEISLRR